MNERSVRFRLLRSEVERFRQSGVVAAEIQFPDGRGLQYGLVRAETPDISVRFTGDAIEIVVPAAQADEWSNGPGVGIYGRTGGLDIVVEKDFRRTSAPSLDDADRYPNPRSGRA